MLQYDIPPMNVVGSAREDADTWRRVPQGQTEQGDTQPDLETLVTELRNGDIADEAASTRLAAYLAGAVQARALASAMGQATVVEIEISAVIDKVLDNAPRLVGAHQAALCLRDVSSERVQHYGSDNGSIVSREPHHAIVHLIAEQHPEDQAPLQRNTVCSGCLMQACGGQCLSLPLQIDSQLLGELCIVRSGNDTPFSANEVASGEEYARWAAIAIANANKIRAARETARVERETMVAHLHDNVAQTLSILNIHVENVEEALGDQASPDLLARLGAVKATVHEVFGQVRTVLSDFRSPAPVEKDLLTALSTCVDAFQETTGLSVDFVVAGKCVLPENAQVQALNIVREALVNIRRHAKATHVVLEVAGTEHGMRIVIQDNGVGFSEDTDGSGHHLGLTIMRERARRIGAYLTIDSLPGCGTRIALTFQLGINNASANGL